VRNASVTALRRTKIGRVRVFRTLVIVCLAVVALNGALVFWLVVRKADEHVHAAVVQDLTSSALLVSDAVGELTHDAEIPAAITDLAGDIGSRISVLAADGAVLADSATRAVALPNQREKPEVRMALEGRTGVAIRPNDLTGREDLFVAVATVLGGTPAVVRLSGPAAVVRTREAGIAALVAIGTSGAGAVLVLVAIARKVDQDVATAFQQQRTAEQELRASEQLLASAERVARIGSWEWDIRTNALRWSDEQFRMFGLQPGEIEPTFEAYLQFCHPDEREDIARRVMQVVQTRSRLDYDQRIVRATGEVRVVHATGELLFDDDGTPIRMVGAAQDVTAEREAEEVRHRAAEEASRMKSDFVSFVSHQLRTPLAGIKWTLELAAEAPGIDPVPRAFIGDAQASADRLTSLVNDLLDIARLESGRIPLNAQDVALDELTSAVVDEFAGRAQDKRLKLTLDLAGDTWVKGDPQMLRQMMLNLLSNAVKYTLPEGTIHVKLSTTGDTVRWSITDSGIGISKPAQSRLFEKFFRADNAVMLETEGTGLGLHLVRLIAEAGNGQVWCESEEGRGATFTVTLPALAGMRS
jgi:PAS domain S-box-containing protein